MCHHYSKLIQQITIYHTNESRKKQSIHITKNSSLAWMGLDISAYITNKQIVFLYQNQTKKTNQIFRKHTQNVICLSTADGKIFFNIFSPTTFLYTSNSLFCIFLVSFSPKKRYVFLFSNITSKVLDLVIWFFHTVENSLQYVFFQLFLFTMRLFVVTMFFPSNSQHFFTLSIFLQALSPTISLIKKKFLLFFAFWFRKIEKEKKNESISRFGFYSPSGFHSNTLSIYLFFAITFSTLSSLNGPFLFHFFLFHLFSILLRFHTALIEQKQMSRLH